MFIGFLAFFKTNKLMTRVTSGTSSVGWWGGGRLMVSEGQSTLLAIYVVYTFRWSVLALANMLCCSSG